MLEAKKDHASPHLCGEWLGSWPGLRPVLDRIIKHAVKRVDRTGLATTNGSHQHDVDVSETVDLHIRLEVDDFPLQDLLTLQSVGIGRPYVIIIIQWNVS